MGVGIHESHTMVGLGKTRGWLLYCVICTMFPLLIQTIVKFASAEMSYTNFMPDYLSIIFAISIGLIGGTINCENYDKDVCERIDRIHDFALISIIACGFCYTLVEDSIPFMKTFFDQYDLAKWAFAGSFTFILFNDIRLGVDLAKIKSS